MPPSDQNNSVKTYFNDVKDRELLSRGEEKELAQKIEQGDQQAREKLAKYNLKLVISIAKKYRDYGLDFVDLIQEGNVGLMRAIDRFDWRKGYKFSTYATWWIRQSILKALTSKSRTIRIPAHKQELNRKIQSLKREFKRKKGRAPRAEELAKRLDVSEKKIRITKKATQNSTSLDQPLAKDQEGESMQEVIEFPKKTSSPKEEAKTDISTTKLKRFLRTELSDRERRIIKLRYGLDDYKPRTLNEVGEVFDLSRERIRQLQKRAIEKLQEVKDELRANYKNDPVP